MEGARDDGMVPKGAHVWVLFYVGPEEGTSEARFSRLLHSGGKHWIFKRRYAGTAQKQQLPRNDLQEPTRIPSRRNKSFVLGAADEE